MYLLKVFNKSLYPLTALISL